MRSPVPQSRMNCVPSAEAHEAAVAALDEVGLTDRMHDPVAVLSGGLQRRVNLACGMVHKPQVLLLDEPTVGVDPRTPQKLTLAVGTVMFLGAQSCAQAISAGPDAEREASLMLAAAATSVNEIKPRTCQTSH
jgi:ABC-type polar amino acid transport system ATPase subunit